MFGFRRLNKVINNDNAKIPKNPIIFGIYISKFYKKWVIAAFCFVFTAMTLSQLNVLVLRNLTNAITTHPLDVNSVWFWGITFPLVFFVAENIWRSSGFSGMNWITGMRSTIYQTLYEYLSLHSRDYFDNRFAGSLTNKISNVVDGMEALTAQILWQFTPLVLGLILYIIFAANANVLLGLIIFIWSVIFIGINIIFAKKLQPRSIKFANTLSTLKGRLVDSITNISLVHEYANITGEQKYIKNYVKQSYDAGIEQWKTSEWMLFTNGILLFIFMLCMIGAAINLFQNKSISVGVIVMVITIVSNLANQLLFLGQEMRNAVKYYGQTREGLSEILIKHRIIDAPDAKNISVASGNVAIQSIDFEYDNFGVFRNFSLKIPASQKVGLVGKSGAGKTTLISLLLRHFDVQKGQILIDGNDIQKITLDSLRNAIAFVPQDTSLFHRTIRENISYSNPRATNYEIKKAAKFAQADKFIENLPQKYNTLVGERGVKLSGGQRQRIAIARAFLKNAPILIFDEATSSLDSESEQAIQKSLEKLMQGKTVIAIAHRLSTLKKMNRIIVIDSGRIVEDGTPTELLKNPNSIFTSMWNHQVQGFIVDE